MLPVPTTPTQTQASPLPARVAAWGLAGRPQTLQADDGTTWTVIDESSPYDGTWVVEREGGGAMGVLDFAPYDDRNSESEGETWGVIAVG